MNLCEKGITLDIQIVQQPGLMAVTGEEAPQGEGQTKRQGALPNCRPLWAPRAIQGSRSSGLALGACLGMKNIGKPCAGEAQAQFDEGAGESPFSTLPFGCSGRECQVNIRWRLGL